VTSLPRALKNAVAFKKMSGTTWRGMLQEGLAMRKEANLKWTQLALAANTPMLLRAGLVEGRLDAGVLSSGQVAGVIEDLPTVAELIARVMNEAEQTLKRLGELT
jgi:NAD(P)H-dependent flavin oxidoreductase YrpB (nitropropane dioxygenase family)